MSPEKALQSRLFPFEPPPLIGARIKSGVPSPEKLRPIKSEDSFPTHAPSIYTECLNSITGELSYGKGADYWTKEKDKLIKRAVLRLHKDAIDAQNAEHRIKGELDSSYAGLMKSVERMEPKGVGFYRQIIFRHKKLWDVRNIVELGLQALTESDKEEDPNIRKELQTQGFIILQIGHDIALIRHGIYGQDPLPALASRMQYFEKGERERKRKKAAKKENKKRQGTYGNREDLKVNSLGHYVTQHNLWTRRFMERFGGEATPYDDHFKEKFEANLRSAGGTKEMKKAKQHPSHYENILREYAKDLNSYTLLGIALEAIYNPSRRSVTYPRRSEAAGIKLLQLAYEKASDDPKVITNFKGYYEYVFRQVYLHLRTTTQSPIHVARFEASMRIARARGPMIESKPTRGLKPASDEELPF